MAPLGKWLRPVIAASVTAAIAIGSYIAKAYAEGDIKRLASKYPTVAASEGAKAILGGVPIVGGLVSFFAGPLLDTAAQTGMSEEDKKALQFDHTLVTWAPVVGIAGLAIGGLVTLYFIWKDVFQTPAEAARLQELRLAGISATGQAAGVAIPAAATGGASIPVQAAPAVVAASPLQQTEAAHA